MYVPVVRTGQTIRGYPRYVRIYLGSIRSCRIFYPLGTPILGLVPDVARPMDFQIN